MIESARAEAEETERRRDDTARRADERRVAAEGVAGRERERRQEVEVANAEMHRRIAELEARLESFEGVPPPQLFSPSELENPLSPELFEGGGAVAAEIARLTANIQAALASMDMGTVVKNGELVTQLQTKPSFAGAELVARLKVAVPRDEALAAALRAAGRVEQAGLVEARAATEQAELNRLEVSTAR